MKNTFLIVLLAVCVIIPPFANAISSCEYLYESVQNARQDFNNSKRQVRNSRQFDRTMENFAGAVGGRYTGPAIGPDTYMREQSLEGARDRLNAAVEEYTMSGCGGSRMNSHYDDLNQ
jgi:hypothetical protein